MPFPANTDAFAASNGVTPYGALFRQSNEQGAIFTLLLLTLICIPFGMLPAQTSRSEMADRDKQQERAPQGGNHAVDIYGDPLPAGASARLGTVRFRLEPQDPIRVSYSRDGRLLASNEAGNVIVWNADTGKRMQVLGSGPDASGDDHATMIDEIAFSPVVNVVAARRSDGSISVWRVSTGKELRLGDCGEPKRPLMANYRGFGFSADGSMVATNWDDRTFVFDAGNSGPPRAVLGTTDRRTQLAMSWLPDSTHLVHSSFSPPVRLWNAHNATFVREFELPDIEAFALSTAVSPDGRLLAAGCIERGRARLLIGIWNVDTGALMARLPTVDDAVSLHFTPDGQTLVSFTESPASIDLWDLRDIQSGKSSRRRIATGLGVGRHASLSPDGSRLAIASAKRAIRQWNLDTAREVATEFSGHVSRVQAVSFSPDARRVATLANGEIRVWNASTSTLGRTLPAPSCRHLAIDPRGTYLATAGTGGDIHVWNMTSGKRAALLQRNEKQVRAIQYTYDGSQIISVGSDAKYTWSSKPVVDRIHVWDAKTGKHLREFEFTAPTTQSMAILPGEKLIVLGAAYKGMQVRSLETGDLLHELPAHEASVNSLDCHEGIVASGSRDTTIRLWDRETWETVAILRGHTAPVDAVKFSRDGKWLASSDSKSHIRLWRVDRREQVLTLRPDETATSSLDYSPNGMALVSGHANGTALVWRLSPDLLSSP